MGVKRWLMLAALALFVFGMGLAIARHGEPLDVLRYPRAAVQGVRWMRPDLLANDGLALSLGLGLAVLGIGGFSFAASRLVQAMTLGSRSGVRRGSAATVSGLVDTVFRARALTQGPRIVAIGGGTGLSTMLRGLKHHTSNIVAVVTVTDDGGSSGKLQRQLNIPPPGDIRNCLVALADEEGTMTELLQYRFRGPGTGDGLRDHAVGNLLIAALNEISGGDFQQAVRQASRVLNIRGEVWPSTLTHVSLRGEMEDGSIVDGETSLAHSPLRIRRIRLVPGDVSAPTEVVEAIEKADVVVIGPGSVFTSVIPNLLVRGIPEALYRSRASKVYVCNVMTQPGETDGFSASDHLKAIEAHVPRPVVTHAIINTDVPTTKLLEKYRQTGSVLVAPDTDRVRALGYRPLPGSYISGTDVVRHDAGKLADAIIRLLAH